MTPANKTCRLLVEDDPRRGAWNMAFDEALLDAAARRGETILRVYRWSEPTLSLGYFQKAVPADLPEVMKSLPAVRRLSGGGAILHDREWTYSCCLPNGHPLAFKPEALYDAVHLALIRAFKRLGIDVQTRGVTDRGADAAFLCFSRGDARDLLVAGRKVVGSAQRRRRGAVLQHGSVLLQASPIAPEIPGLLDLVSASTIDPLFGWTEFIDEVSPILGLDRPEREPSSEDFVAASTNAPRYEVARSRDTGITEP